MSKSIKAFLGVWRGGRVEGHRKLPKSIKIFLVGELGETKKGTKAWKIVKIDRSISRELVGKRGRVERL